jgi:hypothetical protein
VALSWIAVGVFGSAAGYLTALQGLVLLLAALGIGRWADRWDPQRSLIGADLVRAATLLAVVAAWLATGRPGAVPLVAAVVVLAAGQAVFQPALQSVLPRLTPDVSLLPATNGLMDTTDRSARLLGPGLVAVLGGIVPVVHFLTLDAASFLVSAAALILIRRSRRLVVVRRAPGRESMWQGIARGAGAMGAHPILGYVLRTTGVVNGVWYAAFFLALPLLIEREGVRGPGGAGIGAYGLVIAAYGLTNLASTLVLGGRAVPARPQFQMFGGTILVGIGTALMGLAGLLPEGWILPGLAAGAALGAAGGPMKDIPLAVLRQTRLQEADLGAAMRAYMAANAAGMLVAMLLAPSLLRAFGPVAVIVACGAVLAATAVLGMTLNAGWIETESPYGTHDLQRP